MKIPNRVKVSGQTYEVIKNYKFTQNVDLCGQADHSALEIRISGTDLTGKKLKGCRLEEVFTHELIHCIDKCYNNNTLKENSVNRLAHGLHQVLTDNNML